MFACPSPQVGIADNGEPIIIKPQHATYGAKAKLLKKPKGKQVDDADGSDAMPLTTYGSYRPFLAVR
jgi:hypothetical protein